jgi:hypothetical protein
VINNKYSTQTDPTKYNNCFIAFQSHPSHTPALDQTATQFPALVAPAAAGVGETRWLGTHELTVVIPEIRLRSRAVIVHGIATLAGG